MARGMWPPHTLLSHHATCWRTPISPAAAKPGTTRPTSDSSQSTPAATVAKPADVALGAKEAEVARTTSCPAPSSARARGTSGKK